MRLISILRYLLLASTRCPEKTDSLHRLVAVVLIFFCFSFYLLPFQLCFCCFLLGACFIFLLLVFTCYPEKTEFLAQLDGCSLEFFLIFVLLFYLCLCLLFFLFPLFYLLLLVLLLPSCLFLLLLADIPFPQKNRSGSPTVRIHTPRCILNPFYSNTVNLLLVMPPKMYEELLCDMPQASESPMPPPAPTVVTTQPTAGATALMEAACFTEVDSDLSKQNERSCEYDGKDMTAIIKLLDFLDSRLKSVGSLGVNG